MEKQKWLARLVGARGAEASDPVVLRQKLRTLMIDFVVMLAGSVIYAVSVDVFTAPNEIAPGGVTGIATVLYFLFRTPIGTMYFILNVPLLLLALKFISRRFIAKTLVATLMVSVSTDVLNLFLPKYQHSMLLAALYGGVLSGIGLGLIFLRGATTGGTDVASKLLRIRYRHIPMGRMMMFIDAIIIIVSAFVFHSVDSALYAMITIFASSQVIDSILYGADKSEMVLVISDRYEEISRSILEDMNRGATVLKGRGSYTGQDRDVLLCAVRRSEAAQLRMLVRQSDPSAFMILCEAGEVLGEGFKPINKED
jgi:uncharacterized membrane-anchored protein YitT (DUF2179 family)